jgi:hypothetical protein
MELGSLREFPRGLVAVTGLHPRELCPDLFINKQFYILMCCENKLYVVVCYLPAIHNTVCTKSEV